MADYVKFTKDGLRAYEWNYELKKAARERGESTKDESKFYDIWEPEDDTIWTHLRSRCEIDEGVTVLDVFRTVDKYPLLKAFIQQYSWCRHIDDFHKQAEEPVTPDPEEDKHPLHYAEVYCGGNVHDGDLDTWNDFHAYGDAPTDDEFVTYKPGEQIAWSISYSPANRYANLPLKLNENLTIYDYAKRNDGDEEVFKGTKGFSLLDVLDAIYWDISFMGGPDDNKEFLGKMKTTVDKIKSGELGTVKFGTAEELLDDMEE